MNFLQFIVELEVKTFGWVARKEFYSAIFIKLNSFTIPNAISKTKEKIQVCHVPILGRYD